MDLLSDLLKDRKMLLIMAIIYVVVMVVALIIIWKPDNVLEISKYSPYNEEQVNQEMAETYFAAVVDIGVYGDRSSLEEILAYDYLDYINTTVDDILTRLRTNGNYPTVSKVNIINVEDKVIYSGVVDTGEEQVSVNVIEHYPYDVELTLDTFYEYNEINRKTNHAGVLFIVKSEYKDFEYIQYELEVQNNSDSYVNIDLSVATKVYLMLEDDTKVYIKNPYSTAILENIKSGGIGVRDLVFTVNLMGQNNIKSLNFSKVNIGGKIVDIQILL